jgi:hypothetical protein
LRDGWRDTFTTSKTYTFHQSATGSQSRIDRFHVTPEILATAREWKIETVGVPTDHRMISVQVANENTPNVGRGRWAVTKNTVKDKTLSKMLHEQGMEATSQLDTMGVYTEEHNAQTIYWRFKIDSLEMARHREKVAVPKIKLKIRNLETTLDRTDNDERVSEEQKVKASAEITEKISNLERERHLKARRTVAMRNRIEGETICTHWCQSNKKAKPRDMIYALRKPPVPDMAPNALPEYEKNSQKMAEMARDYQKTLQVDENPSDVEVREAKIRTVLENITAKPTAEQYESMKRQLLKKDVEEALKNSKNNRATGLDGATYELWKTIHARYLEDLQCNRPTFNLIGLMTKTFNEIESYGVVPSTNFSEG